MNKIHFRITKDGIPNLTPFQRATLGENEGKMATIEILKSKRTLSQNALYWVFLNVIEQETGNTADDLHELFRAKLLPPKFVKIKGKQTYHELKVPRSTTELDKIAFGEYMDKISAMVDIPVPNPKDVGYITNY